MSQAIPLRLRELINEQVFAFAHTAQAHYKTDDLVILLDLSEPNAEFQAMPRQRIVGANGIPKSIQLKLSAPASGSAQNLKAPGLSFWLFVIHENGYSECLAINASMMAPGGSA